MSASHDAYFMDIASMVSKRASCDRLHVGCVLVDGQDRIVATGYNASLRGTPSCDEVGHDMDEGHCVRTVHAEAKAVTQAAARGGRIANCRAYVTAFPCWPCTKLLLSAGVNSIVYAKSYREDPRVRAACGRVGCEIREEEPRAVGK